MYSIADFSSIIAIEFSINSAIGYIQVFLKPQIERSTAQYERARWWLSNEDEYKNLIGKTGTFTDFENALIDWEFSLQKLRRAIDANLKVPTCLMLANALFLFFVLCFPWYETNLQTLYSIIFIGAYLPIFSAIWLHGKTRETRLDEETKRKKSLELIP